MNNNLLPEEKLKLVNKNYWLRFTALLMLGLSIAFFIGTIFLVPSFLSLRQNKVNYQAELSAISKNSGNDEKKSSADVIKSLEEKVKTLSLIQNNNPEPHSLLDEIISLRNGVVTIQHMSYTLTGASSTSLSIEGVASTRDDLLLFRDRVKASKRFSSADFPVELLTKSRDIHFTMTIK